MKTVILAAKYSRPAAVDHLDEQRWDDDAPEDGQLRLRRRGETTRVGAARFLYDGMSHLTSGSLVLGPLDSGTPATLAANKLIHIFEKEGHNLAGLREFFGSKEDVTKNVVSAVAKLDNITASADGKFSVV